MRKAKRATRGTLLAAGLAAAQLSADVVEPWRLVSPRVLDRLQAPLTRYHE